MAKISPALRKEWADRLRESGFQDIEDDKGRLKTHNTRTSIWASRDATGEYYALMGDYLLATVELTRLHRRILELHCEGLHLDQIAYDVYRSRAYVKNVIYKHRDIVLHKK